MKERGTCTQEHDNDQGVGKEDMELNKMKHYGEWMVVNRRKPSGKMKTRQ